MNRRAWQVLAIALLMLLAWPSLAWPQEERAHDHDYDMAEEYHSPDEYEAPEYRPRQQSMLMWTFNALGWRYSIGLPFFGMLSFVLSLVLVIRGGPYAGPALVFVVPMPFLLGIFGVVDGMIMSYQVIAMTEVVPRPSEIAFGVSTSLVSALVGMLMMAPAFLVATVGLFIRAMRGERTTKP